MWTPDQVGERIREAFQVLKTLPLGELRHLVPRWTRNWETLPGDWLDAHNVPETTRLPRRVFPPEAISRADEAMRWLYWLDEGARRVVAMWALRIPASWVRKRYGIAPSTFRTKRARALGDIAVRLNRER